MHSLESDAAAEAPYQRITSVPGELDVLQGLQAFAAHEGATEEGPDALARQ